MTDGLAGRKRPLPVGWQWAKLGELVELIRGVSFDKGDARYEKVDNFVPILRAGNIQDKLIIDRDLVWVPKRNVSDEQFVRRGDIAICLSSGSANVVGKTAIASDAWVGSVGAFCGLIRCGPAIDQSYMAHWLRSGAYRTWRGYQARGANIQNLRFSELAKLELLLPPIAEQQRIAAMLNEQMGAVERARRAAEAQIEALTELRQSYLQEVFPRVGAALPPGWRSAKLGDVICEHQAGFASGQRDVRGVVQLRMNNVDTRGNLVWNEVLRVPAEPSVIEKYRLMPGDVIFNNTNSTELVGKSATFINYVEAVVYSNHFTRLRTNPHELDSGFLSRWLNYKWQSGLFAEICNRWIGQSAVKAEKLLALNIALPPLAEQQRITAVLSEQMGAVERARHAAEAQLREINALPAMLLRRAFNGEL